MLKVALYTERERGRCFESTLGTTNYPFSLFLHEKLFCFEGRVLEILGLIKGP